MPKNIVDLELVKIIETELLNEFKAVHDAYYSHKVSEEEAQKLLDNLSAVEDKCKVKLAAFNTLIFNLLTSYQKSLNQFVSIESGRDSSYGGVSELVNYKFDLIGDILISLEDDFGFM